MIQIDPEDADLLIGYSWYQNHDGYYTAMVTVGTKIIKQFFLHKLIAERMGIVGFADHKDRDRENNKRSNLRPCTHAQNCANRGVQSNNTSGYKGIRYRRRSDYYEAYITWNTRKIYLGSFKLAEDAARAYDSAAKHYFKEFACLNFPE